MCFNTDKCKVMHIGRNNQRYEYSMGGVILSEVEEEKDVGVVIHRSLKPGRQCERAASIALGVLKQIGRHFHFRDRHVFVQLYKQYVRPHVEFSTPAWSPWLQADVDCIERVQQKAVNMVAGLNGKCYLEKCQELKLETLEERRRRADLVQAFKIIRGMDQVAPETLFRFRTNSARTRQADDPLHLQKERIRLDLRKYSYTQRIVDDWNRISAEDKMGSLAKFKKAAGNLMETGVVADGRN